MISRLLYTVVILYVMNPFVLWLVSVLLFIGETTSVFEVMLSILMGLLYHRYIWMNIRSVDIELDQSCVKSINGNRRL